MLYATTSNLKTFSGWAYTVETTLFLNENYQEIIKIQADCSELEKCCEILDRELPKKRVYTFLGNNAKEIAINWDSK